ncbi:MAG: amidohydrolase, partial [Oscillospiraceae bacterium]|nr:amidohydrolase [Oscillospiraceae bacterium]
MKEVLQKAFSLLDNETENFCALSDKIWEIPETAFLEYESTAVLVKALKDYGFEVSEKVAGIDTAFLGRYGSGKPVIGILGEYDALS